MQIVFRCDASIEIGTGHVMRCITLADALTDQGHQCTFICKNHEGSLINKLREKGYKVHDLACKNKAVAASDLAHSQWLGSSPADDAMLSQDIIKEVSCDWLIIDHYGIDITWESLLRPYTKKIMVIDDLADREHDCDILLDQNIGRAESDYRNLVNKSCVLLVGNKYCLLRKQFQDVRDRQDQSCNKYQLQTLLIYFGGTDPYGITLKIIETLPKKIYSTFKVIVIMGSGSKFLEKVKNECTQRNIELLMEVSNIASVINKINVAIVSCGFICYELAYMEVPAIYFGLSKIQNKVAFHLEQQGLGIALNLDKYKKYDYNLIINNTLKIDRNNFVDFKENGTYKVIKKIIGITNGH